MYVMDAMKSLAKVVEISEKEFPMISTCMSTNFSDQLRFDVARSEASNQCERK